MVKKEVVYVHILNQKKGEFKVEWSNGACETVNEVSKGVFKVADCTKEKKASAKKTQKAAQKKHSFGRKPFTRQDSKKEAQRKKSSEKQAQKKKPSKEKAKQTSKKKAKKPSKEKAKKPSKEKKPKKPSSKGKKPNKEEKHFTSPPKRFVNIPKDAKQRVEYNAHTLNTVKSFQTYKIAHPKVANICRSYIEYLGKLFLTKEKFKQVIDNPKKTIQALALQIHPDKFGGYPKAVLDQATELQKSVNTCLKLAPREVIDID